MSRFNEEERNKLFRAFAGAENSNSPEAQWDAVRLMERYCQDVRGNFGESLQEENKALRRAFKMLEGNYKELQEKMEGLLSPPWYPDCARADSVDADVIGSIVY